MAMLFPFVSAEPSDGLRRWEYRASNALSPNAFAC